MTGTTLFSFAALVAAVFPFRGRIGGYASNMADGRPPDSLRLASGVPSAHWTTDQAADAEIVASHKRLAPIVVDDVADTLTIHETTDDACIGCPAKTGAECKACDYFLAAIDKIKLDLAGTRKVPIMDRTKPAKLPVLPALEAAPLFVNHLRTTNKIGEYTSNQFRKLYYDYCAIDGRRPTAENFLRKAIIDIPGCSKNKFWVTTKSGKKKRDTRWLIQSEPAVDAAPPRRMRLLDKILLIEQHRAAA